MKFIAILSCLNLLVVASSILVAPDAAWTWFNDERAIIVGHYLYAGYVRSDGKIAVSRVHISDGNRSEVVLSTPRSTEADDHNNPSLTLLPDGRLLAIYALHGTRTTFYRRISRTPLPETLQDWGEESDVPANSWNTYSNTYLLSGENNRIFNFYRGINWNPTFSISDDLDETWKGPFHFIKTGTGYVRPYPRYSSNGIDRIDLIYTDGHPRHVSNSVYHMYYHKGAFFHSNGTIIKKLEDLPLLQENGETGTLIYQYSDALKGVEHDTNEWIPGGNPWTWDIHLDHEGQPVCVISVKQTKQFKKSWKEDRIFYYYAKWTGSHWIKKLIANAGRPLYGYEDSYAGGIVLDPADLTTVYISSNAAEPFRIDPLVDSALNENERYEIWKGTTTDGGKSFTWTAVTQNSTGDNLRPHVTLETNSRRAVLWFTGDYSTYTRYRTKLVADII